MITAIRKSITAKRDAISKNEQGFTLIELLVVVLIIGILAAIAIPVFLGQQNQAKDSAVKSDIGNAKIAMISYATSMNGVYTAVTPALLIPFGYAYNSTSTGSTTGTSAFTIKLGVTAGTVFCLQETSATALIFHIDDSSGVASGACVTGTDY